MARQAPDSQQSWSWSVGWLFWFAALRVTAKLGPRAKKRVGHCRDQTDSNKEWNLHYIPLVVFGSPRWLVDGADQRSTRVADQDSTPIDQPATCLVVWRQCRGGSTRGSAIMVVCGIAFRWHGTENLVRVHAQRYLATRAPKPSPCG
jgi:hypothetical protein